jgi:hypothetical protein
MNDDAHICDKCTEQVLDWLRTARDNEQIDLIVRLKDIEDFEKSFDQVEDGNGAVRLAGPPSRLFRSALVEASPQGVKMLSRRDDIDLIDVNAPLRTML